MKGHERLDGLPYRGPAFRKFARQAEVFEVRLRPCQQSEVLAARRTRALVEEITDYCVWDAAFAVSQGVRSKVNAPENGGRTDAELTQQTGQFAQRPDSLHRPRHSLREQRRMA